MAYSTQAPASRLALSLGRHALAGLAHRHTPQASQHRSGHTDSALQLHIHWTALYSYSSHPRSRLHSLILPHTPARLPRACHRHALRPHMRTRRSAHGMPPYSGVAYPTSNGLEGVDVRAPPIWPFRPRSLCSSAVPHSRSLCSPPIELRSLHSHTC